jgi:hypothetical protein
MSREILFKAKRTGNGENWKPKTQISNLEEEK